MWVVLGGYVAALVGGILASVLYDLAIPKATMDASAGMVAFGSVTMGIAVCATIALVPTGLMLFWLREHRGAWRVLAVLDLLLSATGPVCAWIVTSVSSPRPQHTDLGGLAVLALLRLTVTPFLGMLWIGAAIFARDRLVRLLFIVCAAIEASLVIRFVLHMAKHWNR